ncbi:MAG: glutamate--cysteine ligase, partial [Alphaproteobacteria bacterium]|nr:glutamate--cysteine ligase [Alphaproteobacteria bacterium]
TLFPEVRLKRYLEMRGADGGPWKRLCALPALWVGLLYDQTALDAAWDMVKDWTTEERARLRADVPRLGLKAPFRKETARELARRMLEIARAGLKRRNRLSSLGGDEAHFLNSLFEVVETGKTSSDVMLEAYRTRWEGKVDPIFTEYAY